MRRAALAVLCLCAGLAGCSDDAGSPDRPAARRRPAHPTQPATCAAAAKRAAELIGGDLQGNTALRALVRPVIEQLAPAIEQACTEDGWAEASRSCVLRAGRYHDAEGCIDDLPVAQYQGLERRLAQIIPHASAPPPPPQPPPPDLSHLPPACHEYLQLMDVYATCPALPESARDQIRSATKQVRESFGQMRDLPPEAAKAANDGCTQAVDAMRQALVSLKCTNLPGPGSVPVAP